MKLKELFPIFMEGEGDAGGGGETSLTDMLGEGGEHATGSETAAGGEVTKVEEVKPPVATIDHAALATAFADGLAKSGLVQNQQQQQRKQMTAEEAAKAINRFEIDDNFVKNLDNLETRKASLEQFRDGIMRSLVTVMQMREQEVQTQYSQQLEPIQAYVARREADERWSRFGTNYPDLNKEEMKPLIGAVVQSLGSANRLSADEKANFKLIADTVAGVIQTQNPAFKLSPGGSTPPSANNSNGLKASSSGSGGGGGGKPTAPDAGKGPKVMQYL